MAREAEVEEQRRARIARIARTRAAQDAVLERYTAELVAGGMEPAPAREHALLLLAEVDLFDEEDV